MEIFWALVVILGVFGITSILRGMYGKRGPGEISEAERETGESHHMMGDADRERIDNYRRLDPLSPAKKRRGA